MISGSVRPSTTLPLLGRGIPSGVSFPSDNGNQLSNQLNLPIILNVEQTFTFYVSSGPDTSYGETQAVCTQAGYKTRQL